MAKAKEELEIDDEAGVEEDDGEETSVEVAKTNLTKRRIMTTCWKNAACSASCRTTTSTCESAAHTASKPRNWRGFVFPGAMKSPPKRA